MASALYWLREYHADGLRVDAVASMLYRDYSRAAGEWVPNEYGGREDLEAIGFLRELNEITHGYEPGVLMAAEELTAWPAVSRPTSTPAAWASTSSGTWAGCTTRSTTSARTRCTAATTTTSSPSAWSTRFTEQFVLPLSHDEVVHGKGSLLAQMPGDDWQKHANLRALYGYMWAHPGKKLLFMGCELAQEQEWSHERSLDWHLLERPRHAGVQRLVRDLNHLYRGRAGPVGARLRAGGLRLAGGGRPPRQRRRLRALLVGRPDPGDGGQPLARPAARLPPGHAPGRPLARGAEHRLGDLRRGQPGQPRRGRRVVGHLPWSRAGLRAT